MTPTQELPSACPNKDCFGTCVCIPCPEMICGVRCDSRKQRVLSSRWAGRGYGPGGATRMGDPGAFSMEYVECLSCGHKFHRKGKP